MPIVAGSVALVALARPRLGRNGFLILDTALIACVAVAIFQLVPLPQTLRLGLSPGLETIDGALRVGATAAAPPRAPLSVDPGAGAESVVLGVAILMVFWSGRALLEGSALRRTVRAVALFGLIASATSVIQHIASPLLLYGLWRPVSRAAAPYTPFVNRNDLAGWLIMAIPLTLGYTMTRVESLRREGSPAAFEAALDDQGVRLIVSLCAMTAALAVTLSRAGMIAALAGLLAFVAITRKHHASRSRGWLLLGVGAIVLSAAAYTNANALMTRLNTTMATGVGGRREIWAATIRMIQDFRGVGVGVGAFARAMTLYQPPRLLFFNHAHDEYLQVLAEGGIALAPAVVIALLAGAAGAARLLGSDRTPLYWIRAGAVSAVAAIAVQSIWETALRMPANAVLFAVCCGIALAAVPDQLRTESAGALPGNEINATRSAKTPATSRRS